MSCSCMLFFFGGSPLVGRTFTIGTPSFRPTILYLWLVGWSGIYSLHPTDQSKVLVVLV